MENIVLVGGGGHCASCIDVVESSGLYQIIGILDLPDNFGHRVHGYTIVGGDEELLKVPPVAPNALITVGQISSAERRKALFERLVHAGIMLPVIVASSARQSSYAIIGRGTIVMHMALVNAGASIGENCIVNSGALLEHDVHVGSHCHVSTNACVNGNCVIGDEVFIGSNATLLNGVSVASGTVIGAGSVVRSNINEPGTYVGNPIRRVV